MTRDEAALNLNKFVDRYPMDVGQAALAPMVMRISAANLYDYLTGGWEPPKPASLSLRPRGV